ncbi:hypothetical protein, partial [Chitinophaga sp.]|uniref:hypothetical protein n=1 Tax=Chitinophaga sp. TaxID=1869181 RepID=UPI002F941100
MKLTLKKALIDMKNDNSYTIFIKLGCCMLLSCNPTSRYQNVSQFYGKVRCLDVQKTEAENCIKIGNGKLFFNSDMTFRITNDSLKYSNIYGKWDLCCYASDYGNFVFKVDDLPTF